MNIKQFMRKASGAFTALLLASATTTANAAINSGDATLNKLEIKANGTNIINFDKNVTSYNVEIDNTETVSLSAVPSASDATVNIAVNGTNYSNHSIAPLDKATNTITVTVNSGNATGKYSVAVTARTGRDIYFKGGWSATPYVYIYKTDQNTTEYAGAWPGTAMSVSSYDGWHTYHLPDEAGTDALVIFNTGQNGSDRYPADGQPGIAMDFTGHEGWYVLAEKKWYTSNPDGPQKPTITVVPNGGRVKGSASIIITIAKEPTDIKATFNGRSLDLGAGSNSIAVSDYLTADGATGDLSVTASNAVGTTQYSATFTRDDTEPVYTLTGDHRELSIYQIMVGSFQHGDDGAVGYTDMWGPEGHRKNGNLRGIINALDHIKDLGMNAIWMTPVFDSTNGQGGEKLQATGYFCTDYFNIDPKFGTKDEFRELVDKAHEKGMYIILDGVFGHHGGVSKASPNGNSIDTRDNVTNVRGSESGNIAFPGSLEYFKEVVRYWMDEFGVDGWRLDQCYQVYQNGHNYWKELREEVEAVADERKSRGEQWGTLGYMVGEDWTSAGSVTVTRMDGLRSVFDFDGKDNLVNLGYGVSSIEWSYKSASERGYESNDIMPNLFLSNHDVSRVADNVSSTEGLMTRHAALAAYTGPCTVYYGDEYGDKSGNGNADNKARTSGHLEPNNDEERRLCEYISKVFKARGENPAMWRGTCSFRKDDPNNCKVLEVTKTDPQTGNTVVVIFPAQDTNWTITGSGIDLINGGNISGNIQLKAWIPAVIKMN